jgi:hypothetical protein
LNVRVTVTREGDERRRILSRFEALFLLCLLLLGAMAARADEQGERVLVADPYLELRTGPGRGYPIFYVAERGEWVEILKRHTDWFKVRTARDKEGWVTRSQMENTLTDAGAKRTFRDVLLDDYLQRRLEFGFSFGRFENDPMLTARAGYRLHDNLIAELAISQVTGDFSSTSLFYGAIVSQPFPEWRASPFFTIGMGRFKNTPKATLVSAIETDADLANAGLGLRYYITRRFILRADYKQHVALIDPDRTDSYQEWSMGISLFF